MTDITMFALAYKLGIISSIKLFGIAFLISLLISFFYLRNLGRSMLYSFLAFLLIFLSSIFIPNMPILLMLYSILGYFIFGIIAGIIAIILSRVYGRNRREKPVKQGIQR